MQERRKLEKVGHTILPDRCKEMVGTAGGGESKARSDLPQADGQIGVLASFEHKGVETVDAFQPGPAYPDIGGDHRIGAEQAPRRVTAHVSQLGLQEPLHPIGILPELRHFGKPAPEQIPILCKQGFRRKLKRLGEPLRNGLRVVAQIEMVSPSESTSQSDCANACA